MISSQFVLSNSENHFTSVAQKSVLLSEQNKKKAVYSDIALIAIHYITSQLQRVTQQLMLSQ